MTHSVRISDQIYQYLKEMATNNKRTVPKELEAIIEEKFKDGQWNID